MDIMEFAFVYTICGILPNISILYFLRSFLSSSNRYVSISFILFFPYLYLYVFTVRIILLVNLLYSITFAKIISIYTVYSIIIMMNNTKQNTANPEDITLQ